MNRSDLSNAVIAFENLKISGSNSDSVVKVSDYNELITAICNLLRELSGKID